MSGLIDKKRKEANRYEFQLLHEEAKKISPNEIHDINAFAHSYFYWSGQCKNELKLKIPDSLKPSDEKEKTARKILRAYIARIKDGQAVRLKKVELEFDL
jgi:hypothetical protein